MGRHSAPEGDDEVAVAHPGGPGRGTQADLALLRTDAALRARCIAAAVVPFALYTIALLVVGRAGTYLLWIWVPIVVAGVLVGAMLDLGHRSRRAR